MKIDRVIVGEYSTNCYIISIDNNCIVIDPGDSYNKIKECISNKKIVGIIITHRHFDHIGALKYFNCDIYDKTNLEEKEYIIDKFRFNVIYTEGHTKDSITIYFKKQKIMFTGDFIFKESIGRTDLGGSDIDMIKSIKKISKYNKDIEIYPGHGEKTKLGEENYLYFYKNMI